MLLYINRTKLSLYMYKVISEVNGGRVDKKKKKPPEVRNELKASNHLGTSVWHA